MSEIAQFSSIFGIASNMEISREEVLAGSFQSPLPIDRVKIGLKLRHSDPLTCAISEEFSLSVILSNEGSVPLASFPPYPIHLSYHWTDIDGQIIVFDGLRTPLPYTLYPSDVAEIEMRVKAPDDVCQMVLVVTLVQESCFWFEQYFPSLPIKMSAAISNHAPQS